MFIFISFYHYLFVTGLMTGEALAHILLNKTISEVVLHKKQIKNIVFVQGIWLYIHHLLVERV